MSSKKQQKGLVPTPNIPELNKPFVIGVHKPSGIYLNRDYVPVFSFNAANLNGTNLCYNNPMLQAEHYQRLIQKLKILGDKTYDEIDKGGRYYRFHDVDFTKDNVSLTLHNFKCAVCANPDKVKDDDVPTCYQFDVFHAMRAMGYLGYNGVFYLVWFDVNHEVYS